MIAGLLQINLRRGVEVYFDSGDYHSRKDLSQYQKTKNEDYSVVLIANQSLK